MTNRPENSKTSPFNQNRNPDQNRNRFLATRSLLVLVVSLVLFTGCTGGQDSSHQLGRAPAFDSNPSSGSVSGDAGGIRMLGDLPVVQYSDSSTRAVVVADGLEVFDRPDGVAVTMLDATTTFGTPRVLLVEQVEADWVRVRLPARPNHRTGWVRGDEVELEALDLEVIVDIEAKVLTVRSGLDLIMQTPVATGSAENPTPTGTFFITDKLETPDPDGGYGPYAFGLSGYSETLTEFAGGDGQIGIHGTNDEDSIGQAVSHGCIRLQNEIIEELAETLPLGTPVHII